MDDLHLIEYGIGPFSILMLIVYHGYLFHRTRRNPLSTAIGLAHRTRASWVRAVMKHNKDILAVQTLRNWTMASTFLASTAIIIGLAVFNHVLTADNQGQLSLAIGPLSIDHPVLYAIKLVLLGIDFLIAFFNFTLAVRYYNHTGFMINLPSNGNGDVSVEDVIKILGRGGIHYTLGMRGYYLAIPLALWLFGPLWLLSGTVLLIAVLYRLDRGVDH